MTAQEREEEIVLTVNELPQEPPEDVIAQVKLDADVLLYRSDYCYIPLEDRRQKMAHVICTACGEEAYLEQISFNTSCGMTSMCGDSIGFIDVQDGEVKHSGDTCICPSCGKGVNALHVGKFRDDFMIDKRYMMSIHNVRGHLALLQWIFQKHVDKKGAVKIQYQRIDGAVIVDRKPVRVTGYQDFMYSSLYLARWERRKQFFDKTGALSNEDISDITAATVLSTECEKSGLIEYLSSGNPKYPISYMQLWCKYPNIENLAKQGFGQYISKVINICTENAGYYYTTHEKLSINTTKNYIDWKQARPSKMLRLEKCDVAYAKMFSPETIREYAESKARGERLTQNQLQTLDKLGVMSFRELIKEPYHGYCVPLGKLLNYIEKQRQKCKNDRTLITPGYVRDYWKSVYDVYGRMEPTLLYPRDIVSSHDNMLLRVKEKESAELNEKMKLLSAERERFEFKDERLGLMIFACPDHASLIKEGKILQHCVAGYADAHASGKTTIYFIRHIAEPDMPYFTLEYKNGQVWQNRGFRNCSRTPDVSDFETEWLEHIKNITEESNNERRTKRSNKRNTVRAGA